MITSNLFCRLPQMSIVKVDLSLKDLMLFYMKVIMYM